ncbi:MAG: glycine/sarcosine/betaine reductase selenoprotein B family protein [Desulfobacterales bacterium]|nr:glycine/sarcosine/betaine reductase selenoprotein B family protein [Desulfobacterales bacterium]
MARLEHMPEDERKHLLSIPCPKFTQTPFVKGSLLSQRRVALISTAGIHRRGDQPFEMGTSNYRIIPADVTANDLVMSHISTNFDRTGFQQDMNVIFPLDRLRELVKERLIGSLADFHYSFMGATDPAQMEGTARALAGIMKHDSVNSVLLVPV